MRLTQTVPSLPVARVPDAVRFYTERFGFTCRYADDSFAALQRDDAEIHLWAAADDRWQSTANLERHPIATGAESFLAGTASCRVRTDDIDGLYAELQRAGVLHPRDEGRPADTEWGTREFPTLDLDGNLLTFFRPVTA